LGLHPNIFFLGAVSLLNDVSSEMIFPLVPLFLANVLGASSAIIGFIGGISESTDALCRIFSGYLSDRIKRRKPMTVLGYGISTLAKPFMYLATNWGIVLGVRFSDRIGKGARTSSRDALLADSLSADERGKGFGLHRAMDNFGAVLGLLIAAIIIYSSQSNSLELNLTTYRWLVLIGVVPAILAVLILIIFVRERAKKTIAPKTKIPARGDSLPASMLVLKFF